MDYGAFARRFLEDQEIGRDLTDDELVVYCDNSTDVGAWRVNRRTTCGRGEILSPYNAEIARCWFRNRDRSGPTR